MIVITNWIHLNIYEYGDPDSGLLQESLLTCVLCVFVSPSDLNAWWSPSLWVTLGHHERLGAQLSEGNGLFCIIIPVPLPALPFQLPLRDPSAVLWELPPHTHTWGFKAFLGQHLLFFFIAPLLSWSCDVLHRSGGTSRRWQTTRTVGWRTPRWRPTTMGSLAAHSKNCAPSWNWEAPRH